MKQVPERNPGLDLAVRNMRDHARWGDVDKTMEYLRQVEVISGTRLNMCFDLKDVAQKIKTLANNFWVIRMQTLPDRHWDWNDPMMMFCCQVIPLVRAASSSGNVVLIEALADHGVDVGAMGWTMVTGPAVMQGKAGILEWAIQQGADPSGTAKSYETTLAMRRWTDMDRSPLLLACERNWKQGVSIIMGERRDPDDFWTGGLNASGKLKRSIWVVPSAGSVDMAAWLIGQHRGRVSCEMERKMRAALDQKTKNAGKGHWLQSENLDDVFKSMLSRERLREGIQEHGVGGTEEIKARPLPRM